MVMSFFWIKSFFKIVVDRSFQFDFARKLGKICVNALDLFNQYFEITSDEFFKIMPGKYSG